MNRRLRLKTTSIEGIHSLDNARVHVQKLTSQFRRTPYVIWHRAHNGDYVVLTLTYWRTSFRQSLAQLAIPTGNVEVWTADQATPLLLADWSPC